MPEWIVLAWIRAMRAIDMLGWIGPRVGLLCGNGHTDTVDRVHCTGVRARTKVSQFHSGEGNLLDRVKSVGSALTEAERERAMSSSEDLMRRFAS